MAGFSDFLSTVKLGIAQLAAGSFGEAKQAAERDAQEFLQKTEADLKRWTDLLVDGKLTHEEFEFLVMGRKEVATMEALKQAGLAQVRVDRFRNAILHLVVESAFAVFVRPA